MMGRSKKIRKRGVEERKREREEKRERERETETEKERERERQRERVADQHRLGNKAFFISSR